jgi:hypothetical protein
MPPWILHTQPEPNERELPMMKTLPPPPIKPAPTATTNRVGFSKIATATGHRVVLYGPGGIGKTTLAASLPGKTAFIDRDESLPRLRSQLEERGLIGNIMPVSVSSWQEMRSALAMDGWDGINNIVLDSATKAEEDCIAHTLATVLADGKRVTSIEGYGYGKGYGFVFDTFLPLLADFDRHCRAGRNVILICHDCTTNVPNPAGEDWLRYEPRLQSPNSGKASIRLRVKEWSDHTLFYGYDVAVDKDGKGKGSGTRTLWPAELPFCMAKSRTTQEPIAVSDDVNVWGQILK